jgi:hypothetical protein
VALALTLCLSGCVSEVEVARAASPDGTVDAVLIERNAGATTSFDYRVHVVPHGGAWGGHPHAAELYGAIRGTSAAGSASGVDLLWRDTNTLEVRYLKAHWTKLPKPQINFNGRAITIMLREGINNPNAPAGGMEYSKKKLGG